MLNKEKQGEFNPKHRIIGAVILVSIAVIILPMILRQEEPPAEDDLSPLGEMTPDTKSVVVPLPPKKAATAPSGTTPAPVVSAVAPPLTSAPDPTPAIASPATTTPALIVPPEPVTVDLRPGASKAEKKTTKPKTVEKPAPAKAAKSAPARMTGYYVQVGTFSHADNAKQLSEKLRKKGYKVHLETGTVKGMRVVRVRVGPYPQSGRAQAVQSEIHKSTGIKGIVGHY